MRASENKTKMQKENKNELMLITIIVTICTEYILGMTSRLNSSST